MKRHIAVSVFYGVLIVVLLFSGVTGFTRAVYDPARSQDFQWSPSRLLLEKQNPYQKFLDWKDGKIGKPVLLSQAPNYPASGLILLWPYALLPWRYAKLAWAISNLVFSLLIIAGLQRLAPIKRMVLFVPAVVLFISSSSWRTQMGCGQHGLFVLACFIWAVVFSHRNKVVAGILLSFSWLKYSISFPLSLFFLSRKNYAVILTSILIHGALTLAISIWIGRPVSELLLGPMRVALIATETGVADVWAIAHACRLPHVAAVLAAIVLCVLAGMVSWGIKRERDDLQMMSFLSCISMAVFFHLAHDFIILIFPLWYLLSGRTESRLFGMLTAGVIGLEWYLIPAVQSLSRGGDSPLMQSVGLVMTFTGLSAFYLMLVWTAFMRPRKTHPPPLFQG